MEKSVLNVKELAETMGISPPKAYELVNSEGFPHFKIGRRLLIPVAAFERWMETQAANQAGGRV